MELANSCTYVRDAVVRMNGTAILYLDADTQMITFHQNEVERQGLKGQVAIE